jgi:hypothetical protein
MILRRARHGFLLTIFTRESKILLEAGMFEGWKKVGITVVVTAIVGAIMGGIVGLLTDQILLWIGVMVVVGSGFGVALAYGFLPES